jgi:hypothetical protein
VQVSEGIEQRLDKSDYFSNKRFWERCGGLQHNPKGLEFFVPLFLHDLKGAVVDLYNVANRLKVETAVTNPQLF